MDDKQPGGPVPQEPAGRVPQKPADPAPKIRMGMQFLSGPGTQKSKHPAKNQPKTMRFLG